MKDIKISADRSKVFYISGCAIEVGSVQTGQHIGSIRFEGSDLRGPLIVDDSRVWAYYSSTECMGWDFEVPDSPTQLGRTPPSKLHPIGTILWDICLLRVQDKVSGNILFQLGAALGVPADVGWHNQYFVACFRSGKVLILDFSHILPQ